jgi:hypothetical protein
MAGKAHLEPDAAQPTLDDHDGSAMERSNLSNDGQPESAAAGISVPRLVETDETVEDVLSLRLVDPCAVIVDAEDNLTVALGQGESDRRARMPDGVVGEVADQPSELLAVAPYPPRRYGAHVDLQLGRASESCGLLEHEVVEVDRLDWKLQRALVDPREEQEILDEALEPHVFVQHDLRQILGAGLFRVRQSNFRMLTDRRDG